MPSVETQSCLPAYLQLSKSDIQSKFVDLEWQQRARLLQGMQATDASPSPFTRLTGDGVVSRNRYMNVEPFARNRVQLRVEAGSNDYINASHVALGRRRFIATQGPKDSSVNHFWRMLAAVPANPAVIVMLTQTHEGGREKCFQYYPLSLEAGPLQIPPDLDSKDGFRGEVVLESVELDQTTGSEVRTMTLRTSSEDGVQSEKTIKHLLFSGWPDFLVPEGDDRQALLQLVRLSATLNQTTASAQLLNPVEQVPNGSTPGSDIPNDEANDETDSPRVIHCSAGVGRSGTFIALDALLAALHTGELDAVPPDRDPIAETVDALRQQRMMMVQGESQFHFLYDVMREQVLARLASSKDGAR